jgi:hypothetical protein
MIDIVSPSRAAVPIPENWWDGPRQFYLVWRSTSAAIYARSALSSETEHVFFLFNVRVIANIEHLGEKLGESRNINALVDKGNRWEMTR